MDTLINGVTSQGFMPHSICLLRDAGIMMLHVFSDGLIALAYFSIPLALANFVRRRSDLHYGFVLVLFATFIFLCGATHIMDIWTLWFPDYLVQGIVKALTAVVSVVTAIMIWPLLNEAMALPSPANLAAVNTQLTYEINERRARERVIDQLNVDLENRVEMRTRELISANNAKSQFLAHMSHEIRTPMNAIMGLTQILQQSSLTSSQSELVHEINEASQSLLSIINGILDFSKAEEGKLRLDPVPFELNAVITRVGRLLNSMIVEKGLEFQIEPIPDMGILLGDARRLEQVLINLVGNAIKFTEQGGVHLRVIELSSDEFMIKLRFEIEDTGIGISDDVLQNLFQPFAQGDRTITRRFGGTGLGLVISRQLLGMMGGHLGVNSIPGKGSIFWFELALRKAVDQMPQPAAVTFEKMPDSTPRLTGVRVLAVDDNRVNLLVAQKALINEGAVVTLATDGRQALDLIHERSDQFDVVLMDIQMPVMDGLTAAREIRETPGLEGLPIIALTAGVLPEEREAALASGMQGFLAKPLDLQVMTEMILQHIAEKPVAHMDSGLHGERPKVDQSSQFPVIPGFDMERAANSTGHDRAFFLDLLKSLVESSVSLVANIHEDLQQDDAETAVRRLHTFRGSAGSLGALTLMEAAAKIEQALKEGAGPGEVGSDLRGFATQLEEMVKVCQPYLGQVEITSEQQPSSEVLDTQKLYLLRQALVKNNLNALSLFKEARSMLSAVMGEEPMKLLEKDIGALQFASALARLESTVDMHSTTGEENRVHEQADDSDR